MTTAVATAMPASLHAHTTDERSLSPKSYPVMSSTAPPHLSSSTDRSPKPPSLSTQTTPSAAHERSPRGSAGGPSPTSERKHRASANRPAPVAIKREAPGSPDLPTGRRPRPVPLTLNDSSRSAVGPGPRTGGQKTGMHDVGLACLSPGFNTQDPTMREQLQRSISVRDQQRHIIESRLNKSAKGDGPSDSGAKTGPGADGNVSGFPAVMRTPSSSSSSRRKPPPAGLHIVPPSAEQFANERVIMSAPLNQTFTGRHQPPLSRHVANQPSNLSNTSHIHNVPAGQSQNRLPPISDVFAQEGVGAHRESALRNGYAPPASSGHPPNNNGSNSGSSHSNSRPQFPSPGNKYSREPPTAPLTRPREFRTSEEAVAAMSGGREELLPKLVHYSGHPPTPPSPLPGSSAAAQQHHSRSEAHRSSAHQVNGNLEPGRGGLTPGHNRRRTRAEYEADNSSPPLGSHHRREEPRRAPFEENGATVSSSGGSQFDKLTAAKKEKFMSLVSEAWDVLHS